MRFCTLIFFFPLNSPKIKKKKKRKEKENRKWEWKQQNSITIHNSGDNNAKCHAYALNIWCKKGDTGTSY